MSRQTAAAHHSLLAIYDRVDLVRSITGHAATRRNLAVNSHILVFHTPRNSRKRKPLCICIGRNRKVVAARFAAAIRYHPGTGLSNTRHSCFIDFGGDS